MAKKVNNRKKVADWESNQKKAEAMTDQLISELKKLDCWSTWPKILMQAISDERTGEDIADLVEYCFNIRTFPSDSINTDMKIDAFLEELKANPYQLNLIS